MKLIQHSVIPKRYAMIWHTLTYIFAHGYYSPGMPTPVSRRQIKNNIHYANNDQSWKRVTSQALITCIRCQYILVLDASI